MPLTHLNARGEATMVDVGDKPTTQREAVASGRIVMQPATLALLSDGKLPKGDVLATARIAGIQAAKRTHELIPLCHALALTKVTVDFDLNWQESRVEVSALCRLSGQTGVEMEALTAVSVACLTLYDMCKAVDKGMCIEAIQLDSKRGGQRGDYRREHAPAVSAEPSEQGAQGAETPSVHVKFLAELRERVGDSEFMVPLEQLEQADIAGVKRALQAQDARFSVLNEKRTLCAINQVMANDAALVTDGDEVAFFPPVTGG